MSDQKLRTLDNVWLIVEGQDPPFKAFSMEVLGHEGHGLVTVGKVNSGTDYAELPEGGHFISTGTNYIDSVPHGDPGQGKTFIFSDELPAGFPRG